MSTSIDPRGVLLALVLSGIGAPLFSGCSDASKQTGTVAPAMSPEDVAETDRSRAAYPKTPPR
ncbi:hypothetical protein [Singulisphaera acidiphila]|uniref:Uncharacterized protein n=1 Tax=Singulisphaera acidiphila (strain ATCC BAA-1392 / DSM 18658 / VKM B-2454 / MOB10) TaxID=886293 RepID=L0DGJ8_SINAD|nr:hypothetical protein [Singulisphaera acidiphila]AGA27975.1 hypothetical protein Sinac_3737 [Singulisphaera acidiphila DSM 18658]